MRILVINGPNLNMLGIREPDIYGKKTYKDLCEMIESFAKENKIEVELYQSNYEGDIVTKIQEAYGKFDGIVINPAAYVLLLPPLLVILPLVAEPVAFVVSKTIKSISASVSI